MLRSFWKQKSADSTWKKLSFHVWTYFTFARQGYGVGYREGYRLRTGATPPHQPNFPIFCVFCFPYVCSDALTCVYLPLCASILPYVCLSAPTFTFFTSSQTFSSFPPQSKKKQKPQILLYIPDTCIYSHLLFLTSPSLPFPSLLSFLLFPKNLLSHLLYKLWPHSSSNLVQLTPLTPI